VVDSKICQLLVTQETKRRLEFTTKIQRKEMYFYSNHRGQIQCLFDQPIQRKYYEQLFEDDAPGRKYDVSQQCKFVFGPQSELCPYM
ncbi:hypothetical protein TELCIR_22400, partial [Teladorsagia circumcincta]